MRSRRSVLGLDVPAASSVLGAGSGEFLDGGVAVPLEEIQRAAVCLAASGLCLAVMIELYVLGGKEPAPVATIAKEPAV